MRNCLDGLIVSGETAWVNAKAWLSGANATNDAEEYFHLPAAFGWARSVKILQSHIQRRVEHTFDTQLIVQIAEVDAVALECEQAQAGSQVIETGADAWKAGQ